MNKNSSRDKMPFSQFHCVNVKENWTHLVEKNSQSGAKIITKFRQIMKIFKSYYHKNILKTSGWF